MTLSVLVQTVPFEQAYVIARFYCDYQDTNALIDKAERQLHELIKRFHFGETSFPIVTPTPIDAFGFIDLEICYVFGHNALVGKTGSEIKFSFLFP